MPLQVANGNQQLHLESISGRGESAEVVLARLTSYYKAIPDQSQLQWPTASVPLDAFVHSFVYIHPLSVYLDSSVN